MSRPRPYEILPIGVQVADKLGITNCKIILEGGNKKGEGYLGDISFVALKDTTTDVTKHIVIKSAYKDEKVRKGNPIRPAFLNEITFYTKILPILQKFQKSLGLEIFDNVSDCYLTSDKVGGEFLVFDNLKHSGYVLFDKTKLVPYDHIELLYKVYARYHASTLLMRKLRRDLYDELLDAMHNVLEFKDVRIESTFWDETFSCSRENLIDGEDDDIIKSYEKYLSNSMANLREVWNYRGDYPMIIHGDCWSNNMLFKYDATGKVIDIKIIDWQLVRQACPAQDLSYALYSGAATETFYKLDELLQWYYSEFSSLIKQADQDPNELYPLSVLKDEWKTYGRMGWILGLVVIKLKTSKQEDKYDLFDICNSINQEELSKKFARGSPSPQYNIRVREMLRHVHDIGAI